MPSAETQALIDSLRVEFGYDDPPPRRRRAASGPRRSIEPPWIYRWARIVGPRRPRAHRARSQRRQLDARRRRAALGGVLRADRGGG